MNRRGVIMAVVVLCVLLFAVITTVAVNKKHNVEKHNITDLCPLEGKSFAVDDITTVYSCNATDIQLRQEGRETVTFTVDHWKEMMKKKESIYMKMGLFDFGGMVLNVGRLKKKVYIREKEGKGIALNAQQFKKLLEWNPY